MDLVTHSITSCSMMPVSFSSQRSVSKWFPQSLWKFTEKRSLTAVLEKANQTLQLVSLQAHLLLCIQMSLPPQTLTMVMKQKSYDQMSEQLSDSSFYQNKTSLHSNFCPFRELFGYLLQAPDL